jgi:hypothetical protein
MEPRIAPQPRRVAVVVLDRPVVPETPAVPDATTVTRCRPTARRNRTGGRPRSQLACSRR